MTRDEAVGNPIDLAIWEFENAIKGTEEDDSVYPNYCIHIDEYKTAVAALHVMRRQLDENGLARCGCGGAAVDNDGIDYGYGYKCQKCGIATMAGSNRDCAKEDWNTAMGVKTLKQDCPYCSWIDPSRLEDDPEDGPQNYCRVCGRYLRNPGEIGTKID